MLCTILLTQSCWRVSVWQWKCNRPNQVTLTWRSTTGVTSWRWLFFSQERGGTLSPSWTWMWTQAGSGVHSLAREAEQEVPEGEKEREREMRICWNQMQGHYQTPWGRRRSSVSVQGRPAVRARAQTRVWGSRNTHFTLLVHNKTKEMIANERLFAFEYVFYEDVNVDAI